MELTKVKKMMKLTKVKKMRELTKVKKMKNSWVMDFNKVKKAGIIYSRLWGIWLWVIRLDSNIIFKIFRLDSNIIFKIFRLNSNIIFWICQVHFNSSLIRPLVIAHQLFRINLVSSLPYQRLPNQFPNKVCPNQLILSKYLVLTNKLIMIWSPKETKIQKISI